MEEMRGDAMIDQHTGFDVPPDPRDELIDRLEGALTQTLETYVLLAESGDAGFWDCEKEQQVIKARKALAEIQAYRSKKG